MGTDYKGPCAICEEDGDRVFTANIAKGLWHCFSCKEGGDIIALVAALDKVSIKVAAATIASHFLTEKVTHKPDDVLKPLDYLEPDHPDVTAMGFPPEVAKALGIGRAGRGTMSSRVLIPLRTETGLLLGYVGISNKLAPPCKVPTRWRL